ncbi:MAG: OB-fold nucleic acid binding domain-containing protein [Kiritimatiellae bacterium]|nr:OB-fold nucleic acid binding domain-containing protein [Kiritimatiellia bacterium]
MNKTSSEDQARSGAVCSCCERFIGPIGICPYCGEAPVHNKMLSLLRRVSILLAFAGLVFLYLAARGNTFPVTDIGQITPMMNYAVVRVKGTVERHAYIARSNGQVDYLSFSLRDNSGKARVTAYGAVARTVEKERKTPQKGDYVDVTGSLRVGVDGRIKIYLRSAINLVKRSDE